MRLAFGQRTWWISGSAGSGSEEAREKRKEEGHEGEEQAEAEGDEARIGDLGRKGCVRCAAAMRRGESAPRRGEDSCYGSGGGDRSLRFAGHREEYNGSNSR